MVVSVVFIRSCSIFYLAWWLTRNLQEMVLMQVIVRCAIFTDTIWLACILWITFLFAKVGTRIRYWHVKNCYCFSWRASCSIPVSFITKNNFLFPSIWDWFQNLFLNPNWGICNIWLPQGSCPSWGASKIWSLHGCYGSALWKWRDISSLQLSWVSGCISSGMCSNSSAVLSICIH